MKRYGEDGREEGFFSGDEEEESVPQEVEAIIEMHGNMLGAMELDIAEQALNQQLLQTCIEIARKDIWWLFRRPSTKVRRVEKIYRRFAGLVRETLEKEEKEEK